MRMLTEQCPREGYRQRQLTRTRRAAQHQCVRDAVCLEIPEQAVPSGCLSYDTIDEHSVDLLGNLFDTIHRT